jgi:hypothetical protein
MFCKVSIKFLCRGETFARKGPILCMVSAWWLWYDAYVGPTLNQAILSGPRE